VVVATVDRVPVTDLGQREEFLTLGVRLNRAIVELSRWDLWPARYGP